MNATSETCLSLREAEKRDPEPLPRSTDRWKRWYRRQAQRSRRIAELDAIAWAPKMPFGASPTQTVQLSEVQPEKVLWLWKPWIPYCKVTILEGDPGLGKSTLALDIAAKLTRGDSFFEQGTTAKPVLILSAGTRDCRHHRSTFQRRGRKSRLGVCLERSTSEHCCGGGSRRRRNCRTEGEARRNRSPDGLSWRGGEFFQRPERQKRLDPALAAR